MPGLYRTQEEKVQLEARNGAIQFYKVLYEIEEWKPNVTRLTADLLLELQRLAINQIYSCAGKFRDGKVLISGAGHTPPDHTEIPGLVEEMCAYVNDNWAKPPIHLCAYLMWRLNWIHPFFGGNGRTARATSYLVLCARLEMRLPGKVTIPDLIVGNRQPYFSALAQADDAWRVGS